MCNIERNRRRKNQFLASVALIRGIKQTKHCENLDVGIKWPNDILVNRVISTYICVYDTCVCVMRRSTNS